MTSPAVLVGLACRLPGAERPELHFDHALQGTTHLTPLPPDWPARARLTRASLPAGRLTPAPLDWKRFRMPPVQAAQLHAMEATLLTVLADALHDAGFREDAGPGPRCALFLGASGLGVDERIDHTLRLRAGELTHALEAALAGEPAGAALAQAVAAHVDARAPQIRPDSLATTASISAGRIAGLFDTYGGHFAADAGWGSALAALKLAHQALALGDCDVAVVGALSPLLSPSSLALLEGRGWLSAEGAVRPFGAGADGTLPGEGAVALVLVRPDAARGKRAYARLEAVAEAHAPAQPGVGALARLVERAAREACEKAGVLPQAVAHVEAQGSGVAALEDAESQGLGAALAGRREGGPVTLSSATPQVGFLGPASGLVSVLRAALGLARGTRAPIAGRGLGEVRAGLPAHLAPLAQPSALPQGARVLVSAPGWGGAAWAAVLAPADAPATAAPARATKRGKLALVGVGAVAPGARSAEALWDNVLARTDAISDLPPSRFALEDFQALGGKDGLLPRLAGVVDLTPPTVEETRLPPTAAAALDRAVVLSLRAGADALQSAGWREGAWDPTRVRVVLGQLPLRARELELERRFVCERYLALAREALVREGMGLERVERAMAALRERYTRGLPAVDADALALSSGVQCAQRLAARWGFGGGALSVDAACASSLAALHAGALALWSGEADVVLAGGVAFNLMPEYFVALTQLGALSARGSFPFDDRADGFVPAEGAGIFVLKRLEDAEAAGDRILATVAGIGPGSDGKGTSLYAPRPEGQATCIRRALAEADVDPAWVDLVEGHGTGTRRSDAVEAAALAQVFGARGLDHPVALGSIKSQVGHLSSGSGALGLIKTALALHHKTLPPMNGGEYPNPELALDRRPLALSLAPRAWREPQTGVRRAGVSAFGLGGSNYHVVLEEHDGLHRRERFPAPRPLARPHPVPARGLSADRWAVDLVPLSLNGFTRLPLTGKRVVLLARGGALERALCEALVERGARVSPLLPPAEEGADAVERRVRQAAEALGGVDVVVDATAFGAAPSFLAQGSATFARAVAENAAVWHGAARAVYRAFQDAPPLTTAFAAVTSLGGDFGFLGDGGNVLGGATAGFLKGLKHELPGTVFKAVDFGWDAEPRDVARALVGELENGSHRVEVGYLGGRRLVTGLKRASFTGEEPVRLPVDPDWVLVFSGGGRGAVFEVAKAVARLGPRVIVTGRTPPPKGDEPWLELDDAAFEAYRREELARQRQADPTLTPARFARAFEPCVRGRELWQNLQEAFRLGLPLAYEVCDVQSAEDTTALCARVRATYGRIDGVVHGAMVEHSKSLLDKTAAGVAATLGVKVQGLHHLLEATRQDDLKLVLCFGSGAGRFGNKGQSDYCAANDLMAKCLMAYAHRARAGVRCAVIDWTAWESVGAAARAKELVGATGVSFISPAEGVYWFLNELMLGEAREVAIFDERLFREWPFLGRSAEGPEARVAWDDRGRLLVPSDFPLVEHLVERTPERLVALRSFDLGRDRFLLQHQLYGVPILPCTFGIELLAEAAALLRPDLWLLAAEGLHIEEPLKFFRGAPIQVELTARVVREEGGRVHVEVESASDRPVGDTGRTRRAVHHRCRFVLGREPAHEPGTGALPQGLPGARARSIFHLAREPVYLGPLFCSAEWVFVDAHGVQGLVRAPRQRDLFTHLARPAFQLDPLMMDTAFQVAANWDGHHHKCVSIPMSVEAVTRGRLRRADEGTHVRAWPTARTGRDTLCDIEVRGEDGALLLRVRGLRLRRLEPGREEEAA